MAKGKTSGTKPTGPNKATQGKALSPHYSQPHAGPADTPNSNGQWDANAVTTKGVHTAPQKGTKKSF
jgi:hypothetical protein